MTQILIGVAGLSLLATATFAAEPSKLEGQYWLGTKTILDAPRGEKRDRVYLSLSGNTARDIYHAIPGKPARSACDADAWIKRAGDLECTRLGRSDFACSLAITLEQGRTAPGSTC